MPGSGYTTRRRSALRDLVDDARGPGAVREPVEDVLASRSPAVRTPAEDHLGARVAAGERPEGPEDEAEQRVGAAPTRGERAGDTASAIVGRARASPPAASTSVRRRS
jgi:hypothetical protein